MTADHPKATETSEPNNPTADVGRIVKDCLARAGRLLDEIEAGKADLKEIFEELKGHGVDLKAFKKTLALSRSDADAVTDEALFLANLLDYTSVAGVPLRDKMGDAA